MRQKMSQQHKYYFPDKLKQQLAQIPHHPLTIVEAPSGFGKTTAVREYLKEILSQDACEYWFTCLGESVSAAWLGISGLFSNVSNRVADNLKNLKRPTMDTLLYISSYLKDICCHTDTYLIVDNYQLINCNIPRELMGSFSMHGDPKLHIIFITQQLEVNQRITFNNDHIHTIRASSFFFDRDDTLNLFRMEGLHLSDDDLQKICISSEGWIAAIKLQIINYKESGIFDYTADIERLVETAIWGRLTAEQKDFLLSVSVLDTFSRCQAAIMIGKEKLSKDIKDLLNSNDFIRYIPDQRQYSLHSILRDYLLNRVYHDLPSNYQNSIFRKAGLAYAAISEYCPAAHFYYKVKDFDSILSLPFSCEYFENYKDKYKPEFMETLINECPEEVLLNYPYALLVFGYQTFACGQIPAYQKICRLLSLAIEKGMNINQRKLREIKGEYILLTSLIDFNDLAKLKESQKSAWDLLGKPSDVITTSTMWGYNTPIILNLFWRQSGELEYTLQQMDEMSSIHRKLTQGQGAGAKSVIKAEALLMRGIDCEAEILCHKALYQARSYQQISVCLCAELTLARIAILRGNVEDYFTAIKNIQGYATNSKAYVRHMVEHCMSFIGLLLGIKDYVAPWLYDIESIKEILHAPVVPFAQTLYLRLLLMDKRYSEFFGAGQFFLDTATNPVGNIKYLMPKLYHLILSATAMHKNGKQQEAQNYLKEAIEIAFPDQIYLPFAQQECMGDLLADLNMHSLCNSLSILRELWKRQQSGMSIIRKAVLQEKSPLTPREREIALFAKDRFSAKEIAGKLYISEMTVRATLRSVYSKLDIHSKTELSMVDF